MNEHPWREDLQALESTTNRDRPALEETLRAARERRPAPEREGALMSMIRTVKGRPWVATALAGGLAAIALLIIPISYERTTGNEVALTLGGAGLGETQVMGVARQMKALLHSEGVRVEAIDSSQGSDFVLRTMVPVKAGVDAAAIANGLAGELTRLGYTAKANLTPRRERVSTNVVAYALGRVIEVRVDGKSAAQIESEIKQRLVEAGVTNTTVSVTEEGTGDEHKLGVKIEAQHLSDKPTSPGEEHEMPELRLTRNGTQLQGQGFAVELRKKKSPSGVALILDVTQDGKTGHAEVANAEAMSDAALQAEVASQLQRAGLDVIVTATGGRVEVKPRNE